MKLLNIKVLTFFCVSVLFCGNQSADASNDYLEFQKPYLISVSGQKLEPLCFLEPRDMQNMSDSALLVFSKCNLEEKYEDGEDYQLPEFYARSKYSRTYIKEIDGVDYIEKGEIGYRVRTIFEDQYLISIKKIGAQGIRNDSLILAQSTKTNDGDWALDVKQSYICGGGCNNGLINAYMDEADFKVNYETMITPIMLYTGGLRSEDEINADLEADAQKLAKYYEALEACATCCIGKAHYIEGALHRVHFNLAEMQRRKDEENISDVQRCIFDEILRANESAYDTAALDEFLSKTEDACFEHAYQ